MKGFVKVSAINPDPTEEGSKFDFAVDVRQIYAVTTCNEKYCKLGGSSWIELSFGKTLLATESFDEVLERMEAARKELEEIHKKL